MKQRSEAPILTPKNWKRILITSALGLLLSATAVSASGRPATDAATIHPFLPAMAFYTQHSTLAAKSLTRTYAESVPLLAVVATAALSPNPPADATKAADTGPGIEELRLLTRTAESDGPAAAPLVDRSEEETTVPYTAASTAVSVNGTIIHPKQTFTATASAYTGSAAENGGYAGLDYFGNSLQVGTIAVDPNRIPLGTTVYVTGYSYDGLPVGGMFATATDVGGAIKGDRIDIYVPGSRAQARTFGLQEVTVYVID